MTASIAPGCAARRSFVAAGIVLAAIAGIACSGGGGGGEQSTRGDIDGYLKTLPTWAEYSPLTDSSPAPTGTGTTAEETVGTTVYSCTTTPYAMAKTPSELVMFSPDVEILWPGSLVQGSSYKNGEPLLPLTIAERTPIKVSIPALKTADNYREVVPDQATVSSAIGTMLGAATAADLSTPSTTDFQMESYASDEQFALSIGLSGRYMGFSAKANFNYSQNASENTVVVHFMEKMFEVVVAPPQTPGAFFSEAFTQAKLDEQVALGRMGPDNLPIYLSSITYGRIFTFSMTSTATETEIRAALQAAYRAGVASASVTATEDQKKLIQNSRIAIATLGGDAGAVLATIQSGDWKSYFIQKAPLSSAVPLSYRFRSLADNTEALVTETASYARTTCEQKLVAGTYLPVQEVRLEMAAPFTLASGDLNGDGRMDLVWNYKSATANDVRVGFGMTNGSFDVVTAPRFAIVPSAAPEGGWVSFKLLVADMDGDGKDDLVWNRVGTAKSETYVATSNGDGTFVPQPVHVRTDPEFTPYFIPLVGHVQVKSTVAGVPWPHDIVWTYQNGGTTVLASVWGDPGSPVPVDLGAHNVIYLYDEMALGEINGDGLDDLALSSTWVADGVENMMTAIDASGQLADGTGGFAGRWPAPRVVRYCTQAPGDVRGEEHCFQSDGVRMADVNGDGMDDVIVYDRGYVRFRDTWNPQGDCCAAQVEVFTSNGQGGFGTNREMYIWGDPSGAHGTEPAQYTCFDYNWTLHPMFADVSGDAKADLVVFRPETDHWNLPPRIQIAEASTDAAGTFLQFGGTGEGGATTFTSEHPLPTAPAGEANWNAYSMFVGDVNGDYKNDIVLAEPNAVAHVLTMIR